MHSGLMQAIYSRHQFHKFFKHHSPGLQMVCDRFVRIQAENNWKVRYISSLKQSYLLTLNKGLSH